VARKLFSRACTVPANNASNITNLDSLIIFNHPFIYSNDSVQPEPR